MANLQLQIYGNAANQTPCNTTANVGTGTSGDPDWLGFGKCNVNFNSLFGALGIATANNGLVIGNATGGAQGVGTINAVNLFVNGVAVGGGGGSGTVTSVALTMPSGFTVTGSPITTNGTLSVSGTLAVSAGGTGTATPSIIGGSNVTVTGTWPNQTIAAAGAAVTVNPQTGTTYTLVLADANAVVEMDNASANTLTIPLNSSVAFPVGSQVIVSQTGNGATTVAGASGVTLVYPANQAMPLSGVDARVVLTQTATNTWSVDGALTLLAAYFGTATTNKPAISVGIDSNSANGLQAVRSTGAVVNMLEYADDGSGNVTRVNAGGSAESGYTYNVPTTGFSLTIGNGKKYLLLKPAGTLATGTVTMPPNPSDGQVIKIKSTQTVTALTLAGNGHTMSNGSTTIAANAMIELVYNAANTQWL